MIITASGQRWENENGDMAITRILLAEDHSIMREGVRSLLDSVVEFEIAGEAADGLQAVSLAMQLQPDVVVMDLSMPLMNGTEAIKQIMRRMPHIRIVVMTMHKSQEYVRAALDAGAVAYLLKEETLNELQTAIRSVAAGGTYISPKVCGDVVTGYLGRSSALAGNPLIQTLTERERVIVKLVAEGQKNREIADALCISIKTVEKHRANAMKKLDLHSTAALTAFAIEHDLVAR